MCVCDSVCDTVCMYLKEREGGKSLLCVCVCACAYIYIYMCAAGSHVDVGNNGNDRTLIEEYAGSQAQITVVTFLHKRVFQTNALVCTWYKPRDMSALEHMAQGCVLWLDAKTHDNVSISIVNVHQATVKRHDLHWQVTYLLRAMIDAVLTQRRIMGRGKSPIFHQEITLVYICRIRMRLYVIKSLNDIYMSNNF